MQVRSFGIAVAVTLSWSLPSLALQPLDVFVASARERNPDALEAKAGLAQQNAQSDVALGRVLPGISARGAYTRNQYGTTVDLGTGPITVVPDHQWDGSATVTVPLIDAAGWARAAAAKTTANAAGFQLASARLQVEAQVAQTYYQLVADFALVAVSGTALEVSKEGLRLAQNRLSAGVAPALEVDRARADVEQQTQQLAAAVLQLSLAARALESASGVFPDLSVPAPLTDDLHNEPALASFEGDVNRLPAVLAASGNTRAAEQDATAQRFALLPSVAGTFSERATTAPGFTGHDWTWQAAINFGWSFDLTSIASIRSQDAGADVARARELRVKLAARDAIHRQWETVGASIARSRSARAGRVAAAHAAQQAHDRYQVGTITQLDLLQAQRDAFAAEVARIQADADLVNARAQLRLAAGKSLLERNEGVQ
ncbi:MAG TPA: TolC family protein [Myxococcales bacterium]|jgi:outer membrane protein TolC|nr:TolC family protein [Myxococcales bacterium]